MVMVFSQLIGTELSVYLSDIIVMSEDVPTHVMHLEYDVQRLLAYLK